MVSAVGHISGGHFNPAITFGFMLTRRISVLLGLVYFVAQLAGGVLAALLLKWIFPAINTDVTNLGAPAKNPVIDIGPALVIEAMLTFFLVWVVFAMTTDPRSTYSSIAGICDRPRDRLRHALRLHAHGRRDEPGASVRARAGRQRVDATAGSGTSARWQAARSPRCSTTSCSYALRGRRTPARRKPTKSPPRAPQPATPGDRVRSAPLRGA